MRLYISPIPPSPIGAMAQGAPIGHSDNGAAMAQHWRIIGAARAQQHRRIAGKPPAKEGTADSDTERLSQGKPPAGVGLRFDTYP